MKKIFDCVFALERTQPLTRADWPLTPRQEVLNALRFYTRRTFEQVIGNLFGVSIFVACTVIHKVSRAILKEKDISCHSLRTWLIQRDGIYDVVHFSVVIGAIECTYVRIICSNSKENAMGRPHANLIFCVCTCQYNAN